MASLENITIITPTHMNRTLYLQRMLLFYREQKFNGKILIGDSSEKPAMLVNKNLIQDYPDLDIKYIHFPKEKYTNVGKVDTDIIKRVSTKYVCFCGDDDFQIPEALEKCVNFLEENPDYIGAHGCKVRYFLDTNNTGVTEVSVVPGQHLEVDDPLFRFRGYMKTQTSPQYHVMRKWVWEEIYKYSFELPDVHFLVSEVLPCSIYYILGKVKRFDNTLQYIMQQTKISYQSLNADYIISGINSPGWGECVTSMRNIIVNLLVEKGIERKSAEQAFDEEYNFRILSIFNDQFMAKYKRPFEEFHKIYMEHDSKWNNATTSFDELKKVFDLIINSLTSFSKASQ